MQYFYIVVYTIVGNDLTMCKIGLNLYKLIDYGRREADRHQERRYIIYRQPITDDGKISLYCRISPSTTRIN